MQNKKKFTAAFKRIFPEGAAPAERERFARWFTQLDLSAGKIFEDQAEENQLAGKLDRRLQDYISGQKAAPRIGSFRKWWPAAAAALLIFTAAALFFTPGRQTLHKTLVYNETITQAGERKIITLSDGSTITLNNSSRIKFPQVFGDSLREVLLDGEAFFEIAHQAKPFIVHSGKLKVQVLGTSFNVRGYTGDHHIKVTVSTGKVGVVAPGKQPGTILDPGEQLAYDTETGRGRRISVISAEETGWMTGLLIFKNEQLKEVCKQLERWYGVKITIQTKALKSQKMSLNLKNQSLNNVLKVMGIAGDFKYKITGRDVLIW